MIQKEPEGLSILYAKINTFKKALLLKTLLLKKVLIRLEYGPRAFIWDRLPCGINHRRMNLVRVESGKQRSKWRKLIQRNCSIDSTECILPRQFKYRL